MHNFDTPSETKWPSNSRHPAKWTGVPGSVFWRINGEKILLLGWGRTILLQFAHPMIAEASAHHSYFYRSVRKRMQRLSHTIDWMLQITYGTPEQAWKSTYRIDQVHGNVNGQLSNTYSPHAKEGMDYSARMPELLKWAYCTYIDSMLMVYELYIEELSAADKDAYIQDTSVIGPILGVPDGFFPANYAELQIYINEMLGSEAIVVTPKARKLAHHLLAPVIPIPIIGKILSWWFTMPVTGLVPTNIRKNYGLKWTKFDQITFKPSIFIYRNLLHPILPDRFRRFGIALQAEKEYEKRQKKESDENISSR